MHALEVALIAFTVSCVNGHISIASGLLPVEVDKLGGPLAVQGAVDAWEQYKTSYN